MSHQEQMPFESKSDESPLSVTKLMGHGTAFGYIVGNIFPNFSP